MTPEDICSIIAGNPDVFKDLFNESKKAGTEFSSTVCLADNKVHLEDRCIGDICSVKPSSMKCEIGLPIAHVHTHIIDDQQPDKLSLEDIISWGESNIKVDCVTHYKGTSCYTSPGNPSIKGISKYLEDRKFISEKDSDEIIELLDKFPDPRSAMIVLEDMLITNRKQDPFTSEEYWDRMNHLTMVGEIMPCHIKSQVEVDMGHFTREDAKRIGESLGVDWSRFDVEQFRLGLETELEHTDITGGDEMTTGKIALAHLRELPDYYTKLQKMEAKPVKHRGSDPDAIAAGEKYGLTFDGMQGDSYQFTVVNGPKGSKGITFYVEDLTEIDRRLKEKLKEFGIGGSNGD